MNELKKLVENKTVLISIVVIGAILLLFVVGNVVMDKVTDKVIDKLKQEYTPGPYTPGFDPDKVNPNFWRQQQVSPLPRGSWDFDWENKRR